MTKLRAFILAGALALGALFVAPATPANAATYRVQCFNGAYTTTRTSTIGYRDASIKCSLAIATALWGTAIYTTVTSLGNNGWSVNTKPNWTSQYSRLAYNWPA
jgi:hypothetical protein